MEIQQYFEPLKKIGIIESTVFIGSKIYDKKENTQNSDLDFFIVIEDDTNEQEIKTLNMELYKIQENLKKQGIKLHMQPIMTRHIFIQRLIKREPWIISGIEHGVIYIDRKGLINKIKEIIKTGELKPNKEHVERLLTRAYDTLATKRQELLNLIIKINDLYFYATRILALKEGILLANPEQAIKYLEKYPELKKYQEEFQEINLVNKKYEKGTISEFTGEEIDKWLQKSEEYLKIIEDTITIQGWAK